MDVRTCDNHVTSAWATWLSQEHDTCLFGFGNQELCFSGCKFLGDETVQRIVGRAPNLRLLDLTRCPKAPDPFQKAVPFEWGDVWIRCVWLFWHAGQNDMWLHRECKTQIPSARSLTWASPWFAKTFLICKCFGSMPWLSLLLQPSAAFRGAEGTRNLVNTWQLTLYGFAWSRVSEGTTCEHHCLCRSTCLGLFCLDWKICEHVPSG